MTTTTTVKELIPEGTYDVTVSDAKLVWSRNGNEMLITELTILGGKHKGKKFENINMINCRDNNHHVRQALSALLRREVVNGERIEVADLCGRCARVRVEHNEWNGTPRERVAEWHPSRRNGKVKQYERQTASPAPRIKQNEIIELFEVGRFVRRR